MGPGLQHDFDYGILQRTAHRPWAMPEEPWIMTQTWHDLLFAHWPVDPARLARRVPRPLELEAFDGRAWLGVVPFRMTNVAPRGLPPVPWVSAFPELNVRTYVAAAGRPGVYFFSLDAASVVAVVGARALFGLPYYLAAMEVRMQGDAVLYRSRRRGIGGARFEGRYWPVGPAAPPRRGTLAHFLTERYCLHTVRGSRVVTVDIHHPPWPLQPAAADITVNTMAGSLVDLQPAGPPLLHFSRRQDMVGWRPRRLPAQR